MHESVIALGIEDEEPPLEQNVDRLPPGAFDHEFGARFAEDRCCVVDKLTDMRLDAQAYAALRVGGRSRLRNRRASYAFR